MPIRSSVFAMSAWLSAALLVGCADGGSSVTHAAGTVPSTTQGNVANVQGSPSRSAHSGVRRTLSVPTCSGTGQFAFLGGPGWNGTDNDYPNVAGGPFSVVGGGSGNQACDDWATIAGGLNNAVSGGNDANYGFIGAGSGNVVTGVDNNSAVVAGTGNQVSTFNSAIVDGESNSVAADHSLVGGGKSNTIVAGGSYGAIAGGNQNNLSSEYGFIGAGTNNTVSGEGGYIAAGGYNTVTGEGAVIDGGFNSTANGTFATIPGGYVNSAAGTYSFAAGARASAAQTGTFVWSDGSDGDTILTSARAYEFLARASGGVTFWTNAASTVGATLAPGSGTWASASDRNLKTDVARLDDAAILAKVAALPIERWSYKSERGVRHVGPMAQDFYAAFGVGEDDKHITSIDEDGVALASIKALHAEDADARAAIKQLHVENAQLRARLATATALESARIAAMQTQLQRLSAQMATKSGR
jgi:trimeric autotransporter adhesin